MVEYERIPTLKVREIMEMDFPRVDKNDTLYHAVKIMDKYGYDRVVVLEHGKIVGIATKKDIIMKLGTQRTRNVTPSRMHVSSFMTPNPVTIDPEELVVKAAKIMIDKEISSLPVLEKEELVGLVTKKSIAKLLEDFEIPVRDVMSSSSIVLKLTDRVLHARQLMLSNNLTFIPVVDADGRVIGAISIDEVADALFAFHDIVPAKHRKERIMHLLVSDVMRLRPPKVPPTMPLGEVVREMLDKEYRGAIIVDNDDKPIGVVTLTDLTEYVATLG